jgi:hypothetical protein
MRRIAALLPRLVAAAYGRTPHSSPASRLALLASRVPRSTYLCQTPTSSIWSGKRDSNPRPSAWKADALPTELFPRVGAPWLRMTASRHCLVAAAYLSTPHSSTAPRLVLLCPGIPPRLSRIASLRSLPFLSWWRGEDSNLRRRRRQIYSLFPLATREPLRYPSRFRLSRSPRHQPGAVSAGADERTRTSNLLITNQSLCRLSYTGPSKPQSALLHPWSRKGGLYRRFRRCQDLRCRSE